MRFEQGKIYLHKVNKDYVVLLEEKEDTVRCRTKDFRVLEFYKFELMEKKNKEN